MNTNYDFITKDYPNLYFDNVTIFGVDYLHISSKNKYDLYITKFGLPILENLLPENHFSDRYWFQSNSIRLNGTSTIYKMRTKKINNKQKDIIVKWNRMGQDVPGSHENDALFDAEFNSPFEEFSLLMELKNTQHETSGRVYTQKPLAIYVPFIKIDFSRSDRKKYKLERKIISHTEIKLDMYRVYAMIYEWIKGIDAVEACKDRLLEARNIELLTLKVERDMGKKGFHVRDRKPHHIIIRPKKNNNILRDKKGEVVYAVVDYELLERTKQRDENIKKSKRINYLKKQKDRFSNKATSIPSHLKQVNVFNVDYIYGHAETTGGMLWVVGKDPDLFDYFLPERWEISPRTQLSHMHEIYYTETKDNIRLVWKLSKVGLFPDVDPFGKEGKRIIEYGYNSPFEEVSIAIELSRKGIRTVYPRAIYATHNKNDVADHISDDRRFISHKAILTPDNKKVLEKDRNYIIIWGYWNSPDEKLAEKDGDYYTAKSSLDCFHRGIISRDEYINIMERKKKRLVEARIEDLNLRGNHLLLSFDSEGSIILDNSRLPDVRICNFELLRRIN